MATGGFIGDHSVEWDVVADNVRQGADGPVHEPRGGRGWHHKGIDETNDGDQWFTVTVQRPKAAGWPSEMIDALRTFLNNQGAVLSFRIPIEDRTYLANHGKDPEPGTVPQIAVSWQSRGVPAI